MEQPALAVQGDVSAVRGGHIRSDLPPAPVAVDPRPKPGARLKTNTGFAAARVIARTVIANVAVSMVRS
ncbi:hypothetical protein AB0B85_14365 [Micromonospora sp. NPDC049044]|uniref:hypothetical protein n=1 Tax=Micromonospora sp. NPDC049044 TaxID=3154827 RepID=UPI0033D4F856